jgi:HSP20 family molecular chaperone IbpA
MTYFDPFQFLFFDKNLYSFSRPIYDMHPYKFIDKDDKSYLIISALGIAKKDINIEVKSSDYPNSYLLVISGNTKNEILDKEYKLNITFEVKKSIKSIVWDTLNGVLQLEIQFEEPLKPSVQIISK